MTEHDDLVVIRTYTSRHKALVDRAMLEAGGVYAVVVPTDAASDESVIRLCVPREHERRARRLFFTDVSKADG